MIDCMKTENYLTEKQRMTTKCKLEGGPYICTIDCNICPLGRLNNGASNKTSCADFEALYPEKAIAIVQKWSDEHPQNTYLSKLLEHFPNVPLHVTGIPEDICPFHLGFMSKDDCRNDRNCVKCWNQPIKNNEEGEESD